MSNYYNEVEGNLHAGDIAKSIDINHIQVHIKDALQNLLDDLHENSSYILGGDEDAFLIQPAPKVMGRYLDTYSIPEEEYYHKLYIRTYSYRQPIAKTKNSCYSIICKLGNTSSYPITVWFRLDDITGKKLRRSSVTVPAGTESAEFEVVFDFQDYPTAFGLDHQTLIEFDGKHVPPRTDEPYYDEGVDYTDEFNKNSSSIGVSQLYFVVEALNISEGDISENGDEFQGIKDDDFYIIADKQGVYGYTNNNSFVEQDGGSGFASTDSYSLYFKDVYATDPTYLCTGGQAIINGEKVLCMDNHVTIAGGHDYGNVLSLIYMDKDGHLHAVNSEASNISTTNKEDYKFSDGDLPPMYLLIAKVLTYVDSDKEPLIIQNDDEQVVNPNDRTRPRSHHERIRRLEKQMNYINDIAIPPRIKYTITGTDWVDTSIEGALGDSSLYVSSNGETKDGDGNTSYITTVDANGEFVVKTTNNVVIPIAVTLRDEVTLNSGVVTDSTLTASGDTEFTKDIKESKTKTKLSKYKEDDTTKLNRVSEMTGLTINTKKGVLTLREKEPSIERTVGTTDKEAKETKFNPWDDVAENRPANTKVKPTERTYTVEKGKNGRNDWSSEYPGMTFYAKNSYKLTGLTIPIYKFKDCSAVKFFIWKRQGPNNKTNTVWLEKLIHSQTFSLKNAKIKGKYQIIEEGFTMKFGSKGLTLPKGQYIIIALPIPKSGKGSCYVETYKPSNSKDFCIRYHGAANASHFEVKTRYQEVWYNPVTAFGKKATYEKKGIFTSGTVTYEDGDPITSVKAVIGNIDTPKGCEYELQGNVGGGWQKLKNGETTTMNTSGMSFKWRIIMKGSGEDTPTLKYDKKKKYAIHFTLTKRATNVGADSGLNYEKNLSITSKAFDGESILREYIGDSMFNKTDDRFSNFEFARIWGDKDENKSLLIDISASDNNATINSKPVPMYSLHYCDLTLDDFQNTSVDYSNYDSQLEPDEHNMRLKLDTAHSYNDDDIYLIDVDEFQTQTNDLMNFEDTKTVTNESGEEETVTTQTKKMQFTSASSASTNQVLLKAKLNDYLDLSQYTGIKVGFKVSGTANDSVRGLAVYLSSSEETSVPSNHINDIDENDILSGVDVTLDSFSQNDNNLINKYEGKTLRIYEDPQNQVQASQPTYYQYVKKYDYETETMIYVREQVHNINSFVIYRLPELTVNSNTIYKTLNIDQDNPNMKFVKEIGIMVLTEEAEVDSSNSPWFKAPTGDIDIELTEFRSIEQDYYPIYNPADNALFTPGNTQYQGTDVDKKYDIFGSGKINLKQGTTSTTKDSTYINAGSKASGVTKTSPETTQISIRPAVIDNHGETLCFFNNETPTKDYKHIGLQIATDCYIPKNSLKLNLCANTDGKDVIESINIPTLNYVYYPNTSGATIGLSQVFKKIKDLDTPIKSISISATNKFYQYMKGMFYDETNKNWAKKPMINIFIGKIVLYKAETIPIFHRRMRFKFYNTDKDGLNTTSSITENDISIRKIGAVLDYK